MGNDFKVSNDYLYKNINQEKLKKQVFNEGIDEIKTWFNSNEIKKIQKENKDFVGLLK